MNVEDENKELREKNEALELFVQAQADMIDKLRAELDSRDSTTSHSPPSQDGPKQRAEHKKRKRKPVKKDNRRTVTLSARLFDMGEKTSELTRKMRDRSSGPANAIPELTGDEEGVMLTIKRGDDETYL